MRSEVKNEGNILDDSVARILSSSFFDFSFFFFGPTFVSRFPSTSNPSPKRERGMAVRQLSPFDLPVY